MLILQLFLECNLHFGWYIFSTAYGHCMNVNWTESTSNRRTKFCSLCCAAENRSRTFVATSIWSIKFRIRIPLLRNSDIWDATVLVGAFSLRLRWRQWISHSQVQRSSEWPITRILNKFYMNAIKSSRQFRVRNNTRWQMGPSPHISHVGRYRIYALRHKSLLNTIHEARTTLSVKHLSIFRTSKDRKEKNITKNDLLFLVTRFEMWRSCWQHLFMFCLKHTQTKTNNSIEAEKKRSAAVEHRILWLLLLLLAANLLKMLCEYMCALRTPHIDFNIIFVGSTVRQHVHRPSVIVFLN